MAEQRQSPDQELLTIREKLRTISDKLRKVRQGEKENIAKAHRLHREYLEAEYEKNDARKRLICEQTSALIREWGGAPSVSPTKPMWSGYNDSLFKDALHLAKKESYSVKRTRKLLMTTIRGLRCQLDALLKQRRVLRQKIRVKQPVSPAATAAARELGRICTPRKAAASRENGQNYGGRPRLPRCPICEEKDRRCRKCRFMPNTTLQ